MDPSFNNEEARPDPRDLDRKGSVRRAREMLETGRRPKIWVPPANAGALPLRTDRPPMNQWPLPDNYLQTNIVDPHASALAPRGPPPLRPPRPDLPSPSVYSERSVSDAVPSPLHINQHPPSFSHPLPPQQHLHPALRDPEVRESVDMFRKSSASSILDLSMPDIPQPVPQKKMVNLAPPPPTARGPIMKRRSSVSPIPEELPDSPTIINKPYAASRVTASSWSSEKAESDILGAYMEGDSDGSHELKNSAEDANGTLVRQASLGKRGKPSLRTFHKPNAESQLALGKAAETAAPQDALPEATLKEIAVGLGNRDSFSSVSSDDSHRDPEKGPIMLEQTLPPHDLGNGTRAFENEVGTLPKRTPTMSETRPGARRPPRLDMNAVRNAEKRGSLTSLSDLIKRATKLASNLEHGRTASRNDLLNVGGGSRFGFNGDNRRSGSIKDILASFPPPAATPDRRTSWPMFFRRSNLRHLTSQEEAQEVGKETEPRRRHRCCGMPLWLFIVLCVLFIIIVAAAVLLPIFLIVVPRQQGNGSTSSASSSPLCEKSSPCENGGVSVSSGDICSCVCANGFTGSRCTTAGDASCITAEITQGTTSRNATVGDDLPRLFEDSQNNFSIPLDPITIMALFSQNNVSCTTENTLVSFNGLSSKNNERRSFPLDSVVSDSLLSEIGQPPAPTPLEIPTATLAARGSIATENGIVFDSSIPSDESLESTPSPTKATEQTTTQPTSTATSTPTSMPIPSKVLDFSRISVLYIFEKTGTLDAAMFSADNIEKYLSDSYSSSKMGTHRIDLSDVGVQGNFTLNFSDFTIVNFDGKTVGGE